MKYTFLKIQDGAGHHFVKKDKSISEEWLEMFQPTLICGQKTSFQTMPDAHVTNSGEIHYGGDCCLELSLKAISLKQCELSRNFATKLNWPLSAFLVVQQSHFPNER